MDEELNISNTLPDSIAEQEKLWFSIGETAEALDIPASTLRFWEKEFDMIIREMFDWAASGSEYESLTAKVYRDGKETMMVKCKTRQDGSEINSVITINGEFLRCMNVAC